MWDVYVGRLFTANHERARLLAQQPKHKTKVKGGDISSELWRKLSNRRSLKRRIL